MSEEKVKAFIAKKLSEGITLNEIHKLLKSELEVAMTFFDLRMLSAELEEVDWRQFDPQPAEEENEEAAEAAEEPAADLPPQVQIELSKITRPGTMVCGSVKFPSGAAAEWYIDAMGQFGMNLEDEKVQPTEEEMMEFQTNLRSKLSAGY